MSSEMKTTDSRGIGTAQDLKGMCPFTFLGLFNAGHWSQCNNLSIAYNVMGIRKENAVLLLIYIKSRYIFRYS